MRPMFALCGAALLCLCLLPAPCALNAAVTPGIEIDGNYTDDDPADPLEDWFPRHPPMSDPIAQDDDTLCGTSPSPKNDITNSFAANDTEYLYTGMERRANTGTTSFFWRFDVGKDGDNLGDFVFVFCFASGGGIRDTYVMEYDETTGEFAPDNTPPEIIWAINQERTPAPFGALDRRGRPRPYVDKGKFAETRIRLADIEGFDICDANSVGLEIETKSSCSLSSQCKDTTGLIDFTFSIVNADLVVEQPNSCEPVIIASANATSGYPPYTYQWFLNGEDITDDDPTYSTSDTIVIPLEDECGPTEVSVIVDDSVCVVEDEATVDVNRRPVARSSLAVGDCDLTLLYDGTGSDDCNVDDELTFLWDLDGDRMPDSTDPSGAFTYPTCGEKAVALVVIDEAGCLSNPVLDRVYANEPPAAGMRVGGGDCLEILYASTTVDCDLLQTSDLYTESLETLIEFGDGESTTDLMGSHEYPTCGTYEMLLTATDAKGCTDTAGRTVTIETVFDIQ